MLLEESYVYGGVGDWLSLEEEVQGSIDEAEKRTITGWVVMLAFHAT